MKFIVVGYQSSFDQINGSIEMIEVVLCSTNFGSKSTNPNLKQKTNEPTNVVNIDDEDARGDVNGKRKMPEFEGEKSSDNIQDLDNMVIALSNEEEASLSKRLCEPLQPLILCKRCRFNTPST